MKRLIGMLMLCVCAAAGLPAHSTTLPDACGNDKIQFDVKTHKNQPAPASPAPGMAQIVFVESFKQNSGFCIDCEVTTRVGIDGAWVGANHGDSWFAYSVQPGEHHLCVDWQSALGSLKKNVGLAELAAEPGMICYYEIKVREMQSGTGSTNWLDLTPLDDDQGKYLVKINPLAVATQKK